MEATHSHINKFIGHALVFILAKIAHISLTLVICATCLSPVLEVLTHSTFLFIGLMLHIKKRKGKNVDILSLTNFSTVLESISSCCGYVVPLTAKHVLFSFSFHLHCFVPVSSCHAMSVHMTCCTCVQQCVTLYCTHSDTFSFLFFLHG